MTYGLWLSVGGMQANEYRQAVAANNLANADTVGFKHDLAIIRARRTESQTRPGGARFGHPILDGMSGGTWVQPTYHSFSQGDLRATGNPLDVAISGRGFFAVSDGSTVRYTRDGRFTQSANDELVMVAGDGRWRVLDDAGAPIQLLPTGEPPLVHPNGAVFQGNTEIGRIGTVRFEDPQVLRKVGGNLFQAPDRVRPTEDIESTIQAGYVEDSTVNPTEALTHMIEVTRAYELNASLVTLQDQTLGRAVNSIGRLVA